MGLKLQNYNRIINLTLYRIGSTPERIICPVRGRKPSIEITGKFTSATELGGTQIKVKNLYLNLSGEQYSKIRVEAGYEGNTTFFEGTIATMYQEAPGPEGSTIIQLQSGNMQSWLDTTVNLSYEPKTMLDTILKVLGAKLKCYGTRTGLNAAKLYLKERFESNGSAREAIEKLRSYFKDDNLSIFIRNNILCAVCIAKGDYINQYVLDYISAPPQENAGGEAGTYYTTVNAPWSPELRIGDLLTIPAKTYIRNFNIVNLQGLKTQNIQVQSLSFHFSTTGGANSMTVQGFIKR